MSPFPCPACPELVEGSLSKGPARRSFSEGGSAARLFTCSPVHLLSCSPALSALGGPPQAPSHSRVRLTGRLPNDRREGFDPCVVGRRSRPGRAEKGGEKPPRTFRPLRRCARARLAEGLERGRRVQPCDSPPRPVGEGGVRVLYVASVPARQGALGLRSPSTDGRSRQALSLQNPQCRCATAGLAGGPERGRRVQPC